MVVKPNKVDAAQIEVNGVKYNVSYGSSPCAWGSAAACAYTNNDKYGIRISLIDSNGNEVKSIKLWNYEFTFRQPSSCDKGENNYCWNDYFNSINENELNRLLANLGMNSNEAANLGYYLKVEPLVSIMYMYYNKTSNYYYFATIEGTNNEVVDIMNSDNLYVRYQGQVKVNGTYIGKAGGKLNALPSGTYYRTLAKGFINKTGSGEKINGVGGKWNVLRNYYTTFKLSKSFSRYTQTLNEYNQSALSFKNTYDTSIYGKIIITISDYALKNITVNKYKSKTDSIIVGKEMEFTLYNDPSCSSKVTSKITNSGTVTFQNLSRNKTYYVKETKAPSI